MTNIKIVVCTHKEYEMPKDYVYLPLYVGSSLTKLDLPYQKDNTGENISIKNKTYCELTGVYWAYKNLKADYIGVCHYRRLFDLTNIDIPKYDVILPKKRNYYIETVKSQFEHAHGNYLDVVENIINNYYPEYKQAYNKHVNSSSTHIYNMFIMRYQIFVDYCNFLFGVLEKTEKEIGNIDRIYGYIGERLLDVYLIKNKIKYKEIKITNKEHTNWLFKIYNFLRRKYLVKN